MTAPQTFAGLQAPALPLAPLDKAAAFEREALPWRDDVYRFALSLARDESDAEDVVQDTYLRAYRSWHTYVPGTDCRRWLFTICRNAFLRLRERLHETVELCEAELEASRVAHSPAAPRVHEDLLDRVDLSRAIAGALARVPEPFRSAVALVDVQDQPYEAAAEALGVPVGTVRSRLFRGRRVMQEQLVPHAHDLGLVA